VVVVQLPKLAVDDVKVLVGEEGERLVDVLLHVQRRQRRRQPRPLQRRARDDRPRVARERVDDAQHDRLDVALLELGGGFEEGEARVVVDHRAHQRTQLRICQHRLRRLRAARRLVGQQRVEDLPAQ
jgi:hypothetical protein